MADSVIIKGVLAGEPIDLLVDTQGRLQVVSAGGGSSGNVSIIGPVEVRQALHDNLNANANIQVGNADVANGNPVPISDAGGSITVDGAVTVSGTVSVTPPVPVTDNGGSLTVDDGGGSITVDGAVEVSQASADELNCNANLQIADTDVSINNPVPVVGTRAHDAVDDGSNPHKIGGVASTGAPTAVGNADRVNARFTLRGHIATVIGDNAGLLADTFDIAAGRGLGVFINQQSELGAVGIVGIADVVGPIAHGGSGSGDPVPIGGQAETTSPTAVSDGQTVRARFDELGCFGARIYGRTTGGTEVPWTFNSVAGFGLPNMVVADAITGGPAAVATLADNASNANGLVVRADNTEFDGTTWDRVRHSFSETSQTFTTTGAASSVDISTTPMSKFSLMVTPTGAVTSWDVRLQGSIDGTRWFDLAQHTNATVSGSHVGDRPCRFVRINRVGLVLGAGTNIIVDWVGTR